MTVRLVNAAMMPAEGSSATRNVSGMPASVKRCLKCGETKALEEFYYSRSRRDGRQGRCRECDRAYREATRERRRANDRRWSAANRERKCANDRRWYAANAKWVAKQNRRQRLARRYGLTLDQYDALYDAQGGKCAICGVSEAEAVSRWKRLYVDHYHDTGKVRGLLCSHCNTLLGYARENAAILAAAATYLEDHNASQSQGETQ